MPEVKNCLTCKWEPEWEEHHGRAIGDYERGYCRKPMYHKRPISLRPGLLYKNYTGKVWVSAPYSEVTTCPAHAPKAEE